MVDEAYFEFAKSSVQNLVLEHPNLIVLRTMSKWAGLAGLRVGYGLMHSSATKYLMEIKPPYNVNVSAEAALLASFEDIERVYEILSSKSNFDLDFTYKTLAKFNAKSFSSIF